MFGRKKTTKSSLKTIPVGQDPVNSEADQQEDLFDNEDIEKEQQRKADDRRLRARIMQIRAFAFVFAVLIGSIIYVAALNAYAVWHSWPQPYTLKADHALGDNADYQYAATITWKGKEDSHKDIFSPVIRVDGVHELPTKDGEKKVLLQSGKGEYLLDVTLPSGISAGEHDGAIILHKIRGAESLPEIIELPFHLEVSAWQDWWPLGLWLVIIFCLLVLFYIGCLIIFPCPQGFLKLEMRGRPYTYLPLTKQWTSLLFPWTRSTLGLKTALKGKVPTNIKGYLLFDLHGMAPAAVFTRTGRYRLFEKFKTTSYDDNDDNEYLVQCRKNTRLIEGKLILVGQDKENIDISFEFQKNKGF